MGIDKRTMLDIQVGRSDTPHLFEGQRHVAPVQPYCAICGQPAERSQIPKVDWYGVTIVADCCGRQMGRRVSIEEWRRLCTTGDKLWLIVGSGRKQSISAIGGNVQIGYGGQSSVKFAGRSFKARKVTP